jgi:hypothetical protein
MSLWLVGGLNDKTFIYETIYIYTHMIQPIKAYGPFSISFLYRFPTGWGKIVPL